MTPQAFMEALIETAWKALAIVVFGFGIGFGFCVLVARMLGV